MEYTQYAFSMKNKGNKDLYFDWSITNKTFATPNKVCVLHSLTRDWPISVRTYLYDYFWTWL